MESDCFQELFDRVIRTAGRKDAEDTYFSPGRRAGLCLGSRLGYIQHSQCAEIAQTANLDANDTLEEAYKLVEARPEDFTQRL